MFILLALHCQLSQQTVKDQDKKTSSPVLLSYSIKIDSGYKRRSQVSLGEDGPKQQFIFSSIYINEIYIFSSIYIYIYIYIWKLFCFMQNVVYFICDMHLLILWEAIIIFNFVQMVHNNNEAINASLNYICKLF